jgi:hypothetical protein
MTAHKRVPDLGAIRGVAPCYNAGMSDARQLAAIEKLIEIISFARERPSMYFRPMSPAVVIDWMTGLRTGMLAWGVFWPSENRTAALAARDIVPNACWEVDELEQRGLTPEQIVDELLAIEIEMWMPYRDSLAKLP